MLEYSWTLGVMDVYMKYENVFSLLEEITIKNDKKTALGAMTSSGWNELTYTELGNLSRRLGAYIINDLQIEKDERLAVLSESKPEYGACVFGSVLAGLITVPLDNKLTIYELKSILSNCEPSVLLASAANFDKAMELKNSIPSIKEVIFMDDMGENSEYKSLYSLPENYDAKWRRRPLNSTAFIIYTSGTTGAPKGVQTTFKNILAQMHDLRIVMKEIFPAGKEMKLLSILPINHLFELTVGFFTFLNHGFSIYYPKSLKPKDVSEIMNDKKITFMVVVPAFLRLIKSSIENEVSKKSKFSQFIFNLSYKIAPFLPYSARKFMFKGIHQSFGINFFGCISGGAPLDVKTGRFFQTIGIKVHQGYGLSEASPVVTMNRGKYQDLRSVGSLLDSYEAKIDEGTGELIVRGPSVMKGYYKRPDLTNDVITEDGWLHTGDIAEIDEHGLIYITGRIKNMIVLSGGKKVFPEEIEAVFEKSPKFAEVCVLGVKKTGGEKDGNEEIAAVVVPSDSLKAECEGDYDKVEAQISAEIKTLSKRLAHYKRPVKIIVRDEHLPRTSTNKVKRKAVKEMITA